MTKIGIISDTHDNIVAIERAVGLFNSAGVRMIMHAGDWNAPFALARFAKSKAKVVGVFGNVDGDRNALVARGKKTGVEIAGDFAEADVEGVKIAVIHGNNEHLVKALAMSGLYHVVIRGHTHKPKIRSIGSTLIVNPGEACGYLTGRRTVAILDTTTLKVEISEI